MKMNMRGQLSLINIVWWVIIVALGAIVTPMLAQYADLASTTANSSLGSIIAQGIVPMFWLGVIITFFIYVIPSGIRQ